MIFRLIFFVILFPFLAQAQTFDNNAAATLIKNIGYKTVRCGNARSGHAKFFATRTSKGVLTITYLGGDFRNEQYGYDYYINGDILTLDIGDDLPHTILEINLAKLKKAKRVKAVVYPTGELSNQTKIDCSILY